MQIRGKRFELYFQKNILNAAFAKNATRKVEGLKIFYDKSFFFFFKKKQVG
jgi:hypothetical protein